MMVGRLIGKGGETIKSLESQNGAKIQIDQDTKKVSITGSAAAVANTLRAVNELLAAPSETQGESVFWKLAILYYILFLRSLTTPLLMCWNQSKIQCGELHAFADVLWRLEQKTMPKTFVAAMCFVWSSATIKLLQMYTWNHYTIGVFNHLLSCMKLMLKSSKSLAGLSIRVLLTCMLTH